MKRKVSPLVRKYVQASLSDNTRRAYQNDIEHFLKWGGRIPTTPERLASYLAEHATRLTYATLSRRVVAIGKAHAEKRHASPANSEIVKATLHGIRRTTEQQQKRAAPALYQQIKEMVKGLKGARGLRDKALLLVGFAGAFRRSELVSIQVKDVRFVEEGIVIRLRRSKTDQCGAGRDVAIPYMRGTYCPVRAVKDWLELAEIECGPLFLRVDRYGCISATGLSPQSVALIVKQRAEAIGLNSKKYSGHSLRAGLVTSAAIGGASGWQIRRQTGHQSEEVMQRYIRDSQLFSNHPLKEIGSLA